MECHSPEHHPTAPMCWVHSSACCHVNAPNHFHYKDGIPISRYREKRPSCPPAAHKCTPCTYAKRHSSHSSSLLLTVLNSSKKRTHFVLSNWETALETGAFQELCLRAHRQDTACCSAHTGQLPSGFLLFGCFWQGRKDAAPQQNAQHRAHRQADSSTETRLTEPPSSESNYSLTEISTSPCCLHITALLPSEANARNTC